MKRLKTKTIVIIIVILAAIVLGVGGIIYKEYNIEEEKEVKEKIAKEENNNSQESISQEEKEEMIYEYQNMQTQLRQVVKNKLNELGMTEEIEDVQLNIITGTEKNEFDYTVYTTNYKVDFKEEIANIVVTPRNEPSNEASKENTNENVTTNETVATNDNATTNENVTANENIDDNAENIAKNIVKKHTFLNNYELEQISEENETEKYIIAKYKTSKTDNKNHILPEIEIRISLETKDFTQVVYLYEEKEKQINERKISITEAEEKAISILEEYGYGKDLKVKQVYFEKIVPNNYFTKIEGEPDAKAYYKQNAFIVDIESDSNPIKVYVDPEDGEILGAREY